MTRQPEPPKKLLAARQHVEHDIRSDISAAPPPPPPPLVTALPLVSTVDQQLCLRHVLGVIESFLPSHFVSYTRPTPPSPSKLSDGAYGYVVMDQLLACKQDVAIKLPHIARKEKYASPARCQAALDTERIVHHDLLRTPPTPHVVRLLGVVDVIPCTAASSGRPPFHGMALSGQKGLVFERWLADLSMLLKSMRCGDGHQQAALEQVVHMGDTQRLRMLCGLVRDALLGVEHMHRVGWIHCDVSMRNILVRVRAGRVEGGVADLGSATRTCEVGVSVGIPADERGGEGW